MPLSDPAAYPDRREHWLERFRTLRVAALRPLVTPALVAEHRANPRGPHSPQLQLVLNFVRGPALPVNGKAFAYQHSDGHFASGDMAARGTPARIHDERYGTEHEAQHAAFLRRLVAVGLLAQP